MSKYLEYFKGAFDASVTEKIKPQNKPYVAYSEEEDRVIYTTISEPVTYDPYVTFTAEEDGSSIGLEKLSTNQTLEYSTDTTAWNTFDTTTNISLNNGDKVYVRGVLSADNTADNNTQFNMSGKIAASGNCNAIWDYQDLNAPLKVNCGHGMFGGCASLTTAPELPATTLAANCYQFMFSGCTSLTTVPVLPATTLAEGCYWGMFFYCSSLTTAPELPATVLANDCYRGMLSSCTTLTTAPVLPATTLADYCYSNIFTGCSKLTTTPEILPAVELAKGCYESMFTGCSSLTTAPVLPATTLAEGCYKSMFTGCTKLVRITCLATDISASSCTTTWVSGVISAGTFVKHPDMNGWTTGVYGIPSGWTVEDAEL